MKVDADDFSRAVTTDTEASVSLAPLDVDIGPLGGLIPVAMVASLVGSESRWDDFFLSSTYQIERKTHSISPPGYVAKSLPTLGELRLGPLLSNADGSILLIARFSCPNRRLKSKHPGSNSNFRSSKRRKFAAPLR